MISFAKRMSLGSAGARAIQVDRVWGFDGLRLLAALAVSMRHLLSIYELEPAVIPYGLGIPTFSVLSGYLALRSRAPRGSWLLRRVAYIYPSYFLFVIFILIANAIVGYKPMDWALVAAQLACIAQFTCPDRLIGVHTWFISVILVCYLLAAVMRMNVVSMWSTIIITILAAWLGLRFGPIYIAFIIGGLAGTAREPKRFVGSLGLVLGGVSLVTGSTLLVPAALGLCMLFLAFFFVGPTPAVVPRASALSYEFYLCHGPIFLGFAELLRAHFLVTLACGLPLAIVAAIVLHASGRLLAKGVAALLSRGLSAHALLARIGPLWSPSFKSSRVRQ